jgi:flagellar M-ring protein FliF
MKDTVTRAFDRARTTFVGFTAGQKAITIIGTVALLIGGFMVFSWARTPDYAPLFSNLSSSDASAVVDQLDSDGTPYELTDGGSTIMVPKDSVYSTRISLSGEGLPANSDNKGYSILDNQGMSLSQEQQDTNFKRAMEGELENTIQAIDGVDTAVVHLAIPQKQVFSDEQDPTTASVLVKTRAGASLDPDQVQAIVNLVASSVDGLDPKNVTVADSTGKVLTTSNGDSGTSATGQTQMVNSVQDEYRTKLQAMLDRVVGPGNSTVQVTADLDFDDTTTTTTDYTADPSLPALSESSSSETYSGAGANPNGGTAGGVVGPDGQMETGTTGTTGGTGSGDGSYSNTSGTKDNAVNTKVEHRVSTPGALASLHIGVALDSNATTLANINAADIKKLVIATAGVDKARGDTVSINELNFDRTAEKSAAKELADANSADAAAARQQQFKEIGLAVAIALMVLGAVFAARRRAKKRDQATDYIVETLKADQEAKFTATQVIDAPVELGMADAEASRGTHLKTEIDDLIARQPDDVAALLRGWLAERP